ncbi:helix-turn-helix domain-containing protein [Listeria newyorkensis]|uniref:Helix-turn-helix transcriptional regulator n=1 Tax=Listeria newyorkensis TaxID=1497681 RepID=A0A841YVF5_9LIST|nr:helix-turn-helix transcriptional regulator [Listeria newyorkensis]MBC1456576.1 helix-turn-helix transcriptional regulator [Listeria newyorkensis]
MKINLKKLLSLKNVSITELSELTKISRSTLTPLARESNLLGKTKIETLERICEALEVNFSELVYEEVSVKVIFFKKIGGLDKEEIDDCYEAYFICKLSIETQFKKEYLYLSISSTYPLSTKQSLYNVEIMDDLDFLLMERASKSTFEELCIDKMSIFNSADVIKDDLLLLLTRAISEPIKNEIISMQDIFVKQDKWLDASSSIGFRKDERIREYKETEELFILWNLYNELSFDFEYLNSGEINSLPFSYVVDINSFQIKSPSFGKNYNLNEWYNSLK